MMRQDEEDDTDAGAPTLLDEILDSVFEANPDVSAAVGDWSIIATYAQVSAFQNSCTEPQTGTL